VQPRIFGLIHDPHPTTAQLLDDAVVRDSLPDERIGLRHSGVILGRVLRLSQRIEANRVEANRSDFEVTLSK